MTEHEGDWEQEEDDDAERNPFLPWLVQFLLVTAISGLASRGLKVSAWYVVIPVFVMLVYGAILYSAREDEPVREAA